MAKAKKPTSTGNTPADKTQVNMAKSTGSVPKVANAKSSGASATTAKKPVSSQAKVAETTKASAAIKVDTAVKDEVSKTETKPVDVKTPEKPTPAVSKTPEPSKPEVKPAASPTPTKSPEKSGSVFWPLVIGGALAAVLGFLASEMNVLGTRGDTADLRASLRDQQAQITALENTEIEFELPNLELLTAEVTVLAETLAAIDARLTEVEKRPVASGGSSSAAVAAYERDLQALQASVEGQRSEIESLLNNALSVEEATANAARTMALQSVLTRITLAINNGQPFADELAELEANGLNDIPSALSETAETGPVTLTNLQSRFPNTARAVLSNMRSTGSDDSTGGLGGFLKRQLGARSVAPREGSDPDAILSRAEAAVRDGQLADALTELDALPEISQSDLDDWLADARARQASEAAVQDLSQRLTAN